MLTFEAPRDLLDPATRGQALTRLDSLGVRSLRVVVYWRDVAPGPQSKDQPDFDATDPAAYDFSRVDPILDAAKSRGWPVLLTVSGPVPRWATRDRKDNVTRPNPDKFAQFMTAVGRHFKDRVAFWAVWNEPNHPTFLAPQFDSRRRPVSPGIYRKLYLAAQRGLASANVSDPKLLFGETAPRGTGKDVAPLTFMRGALCLSAGYRKDPKCDRLDIDGFAHHAYTTRLGPSFIPPGRNDVTIGVLPRLVSALDRAARARAIPARTPIYLTEFGIQSEPDPIFGVPFQRQAEFRATSERLAYDNARVKSFSQYLLTDDAPRPGPKIARYSGFESGLITADGKDKPALQAFRLSLASRRKGSSRSASIWGIVRPATTAGTATLQYRPKSSGAFKTLKTVRHNRLGYFSLTSSFKQGRQYRLVWTAPDGTVFRGAPTRTYSG